MIPNSKANTLSLLNYSYKDVPRSIQLKFPIGYNSDIETTKKIISDVVMTCPYYLPEMTDKNGKKCYAPIYYLEYTDSAIIMAVTIYYTHTTPTEKARDAVNTGVFVELQKNGIEIPYNYMNTLLQVFVYLPFSSDNSFLFLVFHRYHNAQHVQA